MDYYKQLLSFIKIFILICYFIDYLLFWIQFKSESLPATNTFYIININVVTPHLVKVDISYDESRHLCRTDGQRDCV